METQKISKIFDSNSAIMRPLDQYFKASELNFLDKIKFTMLTDDYAQILKLSLHMSRRHLEV
jgi:hypothetical protein